MAYLRSEKENLEIDYPLEKVWGAVPEAVKTLQWKIEEQNSETHHLKIKTKSGILSYSSTVLIDLSAIDEVKSKIAIAVETPVTTITSVADFGRTRDRLEQFIEALAKFLEKPS